MDYYGASRQSLLYYLIFPIDAWVRHADREYAVFKLQKQHEVFPIMVVLMPLLVLLSGISLDLGLMGNVLFYAVEAILLSLVCMFYIKLANTGFMVELVLNFWLSFLMIAACLGLLAFLIGAIF